MILPAMIIMENSKMNTENIFYFKNESNSKILEIKNIISKQMSDLIILECENINEWENVGFYKAKIMPQIEKNVKINKIFQEYIKEYIEMNKKLFYKIYNKEVILKMIYMQKWPIGSYAVRHNDTHNYDGTPAFVDCKLSTVLYLYNNFEGGNLEFPEHGISITPNQGSLYMFDGGPQNEHQVTEITDGIRYTLVSFWDFSGSNYTEEEIEMSKKSQDRWLKYIKENT